MTEKNRNWTLKMYHLNYFDVIFCTDAFGLGVDSPCQHVLELGIASNLPTHIQRTGRSRYLGSMCRTLVIISVPVVIEAYKLYLSDDRAVLAYNKAILHFLDTKQCRQVSLGLWPSELCHQQTCEHRCDVCSFYFDSKVINIVDCARILVGNGFHDDSGIIGEMRKHDQPLTLSNIVNEWEERVHLQNIDGDKIERNLRQFIILLLCAKTFIQPVVVGHHVHLHVPSPFLLTSLYTLHEIQDTFLFKSPI